MKPAIVVAAAFYVAIGQSALAADKDWSPKANDYCAQFLLNSIDPDSHLVTPMKDPAIATYVADFKIKTGMDDKEGKLAFLALLGYCNAHGAMKLADAAPNALESFLKFQKNPSDTGPPAPILIQPPAGSTQPEQAGELPKEREAGCKEWI
jgi:hypothetical protein